MKWLSRSLIAARRAQRVAGEAACGILVGCKRLGPVPGSPQAASLVRGCARRKPAQTRYEARAARVLQDDCPGHAWLFRLDALLQNADGVSQNGTHEAWVRRACDINCKRRTEVPRINLLSAGVRLIVCAEQDGQIVMAAVFSPACGRAVPDVVARGSECSCIQKHLAYFQITMKCGLMERG